MTHRCSTVDRMFREQFESGAFRPAEFNHRAHLRLAYVCLTEHDSATAQCLMSDALHRFLDTHGIDRAKYHETLTRAWIMAVRHFMELTPGAESADAFIDQDPRMLDSTIMRTHYSAETLFLPEARARFIEPDLDPIPRHDRGR